ncbi:putative UDP-glucuronosyl/UDP-glucosyltransferase [Rosa chinensis]|uniref:Glycosyltransferase n=1 Tax=Rosa chinensis TaxID=74649 RepID=A0A2P6RHY6_ROSCH|nr:mogroside IE synthase [Rosa chinensis]PRQ46042.1 putative UDP-glucuronosyl/UDP-glucosyltransferase [Rosa chinensis]
MERECETISAAPPEILVFPFPGQGHMCPMVQFSKRLASKGLRVTVVSTISAAKSIQQSPAHAQAFQVEFISDGSKEENKSETLDEAIERFKKATTQTLTELIINIQNKNTTTTICTSNGDHASSVEQVPPKLKLKLLIYDSGMPWVLDIARQQGIEGAPFFTQSCAIASVYYHFREGACKIITTAPTSGLDDDSEAANHGRSSPSTDTILLPAMPPLGVNDLPSFLCDTHSYPVLCKHTLNQFSNFREAKWQLYNTFDTLEHEVVKWMTSQSWAVKTVGPTIPSMFLDKRFEDDKDYSFNLFEPVETYLKWLDSKETGSVVYASFGSYGSLEKKQMEEIAWGLKNSNYHFLWVVRELEKEKLPKNFIKEVLDSADQKGLVVSWCSQLRVLAHKALGCFVTHCGWNSTLEALSLGAPMVAMPQWTDQTTNAKFVQDVWKAGVRVRVDEKLGVTTKEEIANCIRQVMEEEKGVEIRKALSNWKQLAKEAVNQGGSSDQNIEEFVAQLLLI